MFQLLSTSFSQSKSSKPIKDYKRSTAQSLHKKSVATLGNGDLQNAVKLPKDEQLNEWLAVHVVDFYNSVGLLYGQIDQCTDLHCPKMKAGGMYEYLWRNEFTKDKNSGKPEELSAPKYIKRSLDWTQELLDNEEIFPTNSDVPFPKKFDKYVKSIFKKFFRIFAHIMLDHYKQVTALGLEAHMNSSLKHFILFVIEFNLLSKTDMEPLQDWIKNRIGEEYWTKLKK